MTRKKPEVETPEEEVEEVTLETLDVEEEPIPVLSQNEHIDRYLRNARKETK